MITEPTSRIYQFIKLYFEQNHYAPTLQEIADGCAVGKTTAGYHVNRLAKARKIAVKPRRSRGIVLLEDQEEEAW